MKIQCMLKCKFPSISSPPTQFLILYVLASFWIRVVDKVLSLNVLRPGAVLVFPQFPHPLFNTGMADSHFLLQNCHEMPEAALFYQRLPAALSLAMTQLMKAHMQRKKPLAQVEIISSPRTSGMKRVKYKLANASRCKICPGGDLSRPETAQFTACVIYHGTISVLHQLE